MKIDVSCTIGQIAAAQPDSIPVFEKFNIDYCTQGGRSLGHACYVAGVPLAEVVSALESLDPSGEESQGIEKDLRDKPMGAIIEYIVEVHHTYTKQQLDMIEELLDELMESADLPTPGIADLRGQFREMAQNWREHLLEEEKVVFPYLIEVEEAIEKGRAIPRSFQNLNSQTHPIRILQEENGIMARQWAKIRQLTNDFDPPPDAAGDIKTLYHAFRELEQDNRRHMHLENNLLFQKAKQLGLLNEERRYGNPDPQKAAL